MGALLGLALALAGGGFAHAQTLDTRAALFIAPFAQHQARAAPPASRFAFMTSGPPAHRGAIAFDQPTYLRAADEGALDFGGADEHGALSLSGGGYDFSVVPQGAVESGGGASSAQAGAMVRLGADLQGKVMEGLNRLGMKTVSPAALQNRGRLYLFAAYSGRQIGLNIAHGTQGGIQRLGWSAEGASTLVSDAQAGVGWRKGAWQASVGYVHRDVNSNYDNGFGNVGMQRLSDNMVAFTLSVHPR